MWPLLPPILLFIPWVLAIWPQPVLITQGNSALWFTKDVTVTYNGASYIASNSYYDTTNPSSLIIVQGALLRAIDIIASQSIVPWKLLPRNTLSEFEPDASSFKTYISCIEISLNSTSDSVRPLAGEVNESYEMTVTTEGTATISAASHFGILHGLQTFTQLFYEHSSGVGPYMNIAPVSISDGPKFPHRGLNMDVARNWYPVDVILRTIDALSWSKFNRLRLHITDAQSWPLDIPAMPKLSEKGAYQKGLSYTPQDLDTIHQYAVSRGMQVILEVDMPGHTTSISYAYPDLIAAAHAQPWDTYCAKPPCGTLKLNDSAVYDFLQKLFDDVLPRVSPYTSYFHTGGDEVNRQAYLLDSTVNSNDTAVLAHLLQQFVDRNHAQVRDAGLTPMVWEEMLLDWNLNLGYDVIVQAWQSDEAVAQIVAQGHKAIGGNYNFWYLDCGKGQWIDFDNGDSFQTYYPFPDYCSPMNNWRLVYSYDPLGSVPPENAHLVLGAETHIWSEQTDPVNFDDMVWPRASAAGEVLWSGRQDASGQNRSQITASPRLAEMRERLVARGIGAGPVQMIFCTQADATECSL